MDPKTEEALDASIKHWEEICSVSPFGNVQLGNAACALCQMFNHKPLVQSCLGCPVFEASGRSVCGNTPYANAFDAYRNWQTAKDFFKSALIDLPADDPFRSTTTLWDELQAAHSKFISAAMDELNFLRSLKKHKNLVTGTLRV